MDYNGSTKLPPHKSDELTDEEVIAALVDNDLTVRLIPEKTFRVEVQVRDFIEIESPSDWQWTNNQ